MGVREFIAKIGNREGEGEGAEHVVRAGDVSSEEFWRELRGLVSAFFLRMGMGFEEENRKIREGVLIHFAETD